MEYAKKQTTNTTRIHQSLVIGESILILCLVSIVHSLYLFCIVLSVVYIDEPTSGLDSSSAYKIVKVCAALAQLGHSIVLTILQPSSKVFEMMCNYDFSLLLLEGGRMAYQGLVRDAVEFFADAGFPVPSLVNPFDHFLDIINTQFQETSANADRVVAKFQETRLKALEEAVESSRKEANKLGVETLYNSNGFQQVKVLLRRNFINNLKVRFLCLATHAHIH